MPELPYLFAKEPVRPADANVLASRLKAVVSPTRMEILSILSGRPGLIAEDFVVILDLAQPTIAHHMHILREAGLVSAVRVGRCTRYTVDRDALRALSDAIRPAGAR
jgi:ArsR family transcriptional regulator